MGTFNVSLKTLTDRVSMEVVYTPRALDEISVEIAEVNRPGLLLAGCFLAGSAAFLGFPSVLALAGWAGFCAFFAGAFCPSAALPFP